MAIAQYPIGHSLQWTNQIGVALLSAGRSSTLAHDSASPTAKSGLVFYHQASYRHGISYCHAATDHTLKGPGPTAKV